VADSINAEEGAPITLYAFANGGHDWFRYILYTAVVLFAYSTCISWSYYGERCWAQLFGPSTSIVYKLLFLLFTFLGSVVTRGNILAFSDLMILGMSLPNLLGVFLLSGIVKRHLDDYVQRLKKGEIKTYKEQLALGEHEAHRPLPVDHDHDPS
jgi:AGCS family alanine or glycine:cation symporter